MVFAIERGQLKKPKPDELLLDLRHPGRPRSAPKPPPPRDENGRVPAQFDRSKAARFFGQPSRA